MVFLSKIHYKYSNSIHCFWYPFPLVSNQDRELHKEAVLSAMAQQGLVTVYTNRQNLMKRKRQREKRRERGGDCKRRMAKMQKTLAAAFTSLAFDVINNSRAHTSDTAQQSSLIDISHLNTPDSQYQLSWIIHREINTNVNAQSCNVKGSEKTFPGPVPISGWAPKVNGVYSGPWPILRPSFREIHSVVFVKYCWHTKQRTLLPPPLWQRL